MLISVMFFALVMQGQGLDVSHHQGTINWRKVKASGKVSFVYIKATEGASFKDDCYTKNLDSARAAGILAGSYHMYSPRTTAYQQMANIRKTIKKKKQDLVPVLDIEEKHSKGLYMTRVDKLLELMEKEYGVKPVIYTSEKVYFTHFSGKKYRPYHFFIANYRRKPRCRYTLWQYTEKGTVSGVKGAVDRSKFASNHSLVDIKMPKKKKS